MCATQCTDEWTAGCANTLINVALCRRRCCQPVTGGWEEPHDSQRKVPIREGIHRSYTIPATSCCAILAMKCVMRLLCTVNICMFNWLAR